MRPAKFVCVRPKIEKVPNLFELFGKYVIVLNSDKGGDDEPFKEPVM